MEGARAVSNDMFYVSCQV